MDSHLYIVVDVSHPPDSDLVPRQKQVDIVCFIGQGSNWAALKCTGAAVCLDNDEAALLRGDEGVRGRSVWPARPVRFEYELPPVSAEVLAAGIQLQCKCDLILCGHDKHTYHAGKN